MLVFFCSRGEGGRVYLFMIVTERKNFPTLTAAFTAKYGAPCRKRNKIVQNGLGAEFESGEVTWCFKTGQMIASEIGPRITHSTVIPKYLQTPVLERGLHPPDYCKFENNFASS
jgi:hypothetical protein